MVVLTEESGRRENSSNQRFCGWISEGEGLSIEHRVTIHNYDCQQPNQQWLEGKGWQAASHLDHATPRQGCFPSGRKVC